MSDDRKTYDSPDKYLNKGAILTEDPKVFPSKEPGKPPMVILKFTSESRRKNNNDKVRTMWWEANVRAFDAEAAAYLKKGDQLPIEGKPYQEDWERNGKSGTSFKLDQAEITISIELRKKLKERGFTPGQKGTPAPNTKREVKDVNFGDED